jgi:hypothetical protein
VTPEDDPAPVPAIVARRLAVSVERLLSAWGNFAVERRQRLVERLAAASAERAAQAPLHVESAAREAVDVLVSQWAAALADGDRPIPVEALRAAFLAIDGAQRWPEQFLEVPPVPAFRDELRRALPRALPAAAPLDMPEQRL